MLITMKELLQVADQNEFAVPAFNIGSGSILRGVVESANGLLELNGEYFAG